MAFTDITIHNMKAHQISALASPHYIHMATITHKVVEAINTPSKKLATTLYLRWMMKLKSLSISYYDQMTIFVE